MGECFMFGRGKLQTLDPVFANNEWEKIIAACQSGRVPDSWAVGNQKAMTIDGTDYLIDIIGINHDTYADGSGTAPLTFQMHDTYEPTDGSLRAMNSTDTNSGGWTSCAMRTTNLLAALALMPSEVQAGVREVNKLTSAGSQSTTINTTADKLFLLSEIEVFGAVTYSVSGEGSQYAYYSAGNSKVKYQNGNYTNGGERSWWLRSPRNNYTDSFCYVQTGGTASANAANTSYNYATSFAFCF